MRVKSPLTRFAVVTQQPVVIRPPQQPLKRTSQLISPAVSVMALILATQTAATSEHMCVVLLTAESLMQSISSHVCPKITPLWYFLKFV